MRSPARVISLFCRVARIIPAGTEPKRAMPVSAPVEEEYPMLSKTRRGRRLPRPFWYDAMLLAMEAQEVIFLRMLKLASGGPHAQAEATRMITEKAAAGSAAATKLLTGGSPRAITTDYRRKVKANARRLRK
jgi:hypothetical protein